jgi:cellulose synthase/poly-beta-1,6-N-acetylglucosamine synthase-like glycosyltransferase
MSVVALIPAHNEALDIKQTIQSVHCQTLRPDLVIVIADNYTDETAAIAKDCGVKVVQTLNNTAKKAGALNQGFDYCLKHYPDTDYILQMDADTMLDTHFVERTVLSMRKQPKIGGLGASFVGRKKKAETLFGRFLVWSQRLEFLRFHEHQLTHQTSVLSGTASLFRVAALKTLLGLYGFVWDESSIVEDFKATKRLQRENWLCMTDRSFIAHTDVMTTWNSLFRQRLRWQRGTLEVVFKDFRGERCARLNAWQQRFAYGMIVPHIAGYIFIVVSLCLWGLHFTVLIFVWIATSLYQAWSARKLGWKSSLLAATIIPIEVYNFIRYVWLIKSLYLYKNPTHPQEW